MIGTFAKWYVRKLRSHPMFTNVGTALVLMTAGDTMAQKIEMHSQSGQLGDDFDQRLQLHFSAVNDTDITAAECGAMALARQARQQSEGHPKLSFRRYGTLSPDLDKLQKEYEAPSNRGARSGDNESDGATDSCSGSAEKQDGANVNYGGDGKLFLATSTSSIKEIMKEIRFLLGDVEDVVRHEVRSIDLFRTGTMTAWAVGAYTPFYVILYRIFDTYLPMTTTPLSVMTRVTFSFLASVPVNAAFFCYGSFVHHITEWASQLQNEQEKAQQKGGSAPESVQDLIRRVPFDASAAHLAAKAKLEAELYNTVVTSGTAWIPINMINFTFVPPHLRPLTLMVCSAFWNCYLSLAQHREC